MLFYMFNDITGDSRTSILPFYYFLFYCLMVVGWLPQLWALQPHSRVDEKRKKGASGICPILSRQQQVFLETFRKVFLQIFSQNYIRKPFRDEMKPLENKYLARFFAVIYKISSLLAGENREMDIEQTINNVYSTIRALPIPHSF